MSIFKDLAAGRIINIMKLFFFNWDFRGLDLDGSSVYQ